MRIVCLKGFFKGISFDDGSCVDGSTWMGSPSFFLQGYLCEFFCKISLFPRFERRPRGAPTQSARGDAAGSAMGVVSGPPRSSAMGTTWAALGGGPGDVWGTGGVAAGAAGLATGQPDAKLPNRCR